MRQSLIYQEEDYAHVYRWWSVVSHSYSRPCGGADVITSIFIRRCGRCSSPYDWRRSTSRSLRMTYCNSLCEAADLGGTIESMLDIARAPRNPVPAVGSLPLTSGALDDLWSVPTCPRCDSGLDLDADGTRSCANCGARIVAEESYPPIASPTFSAMRYGGYI